MIESGASGSLLSGSSTREAEAAPLPEEKENDPIQPAMVRHRIQEDSPASLAMHSSPAEVIRPEAALVVPESLANLEIGSLEIGGGSDELGFEDAAAGFDT